MDISEIENVLRSLRSGGYCLVKFANITTDNLNDSITCNMSDYLNNSEVNELVELIDRTSDIMPDLVREQSGSLPSERINNALGAILLMVKDRGDG